jgi:hypothetical protein
MLTTNLRPMIFKKEFVVKIRAGPNAKTNGNKKTCGKPDGTTEHTEYTEIKKIKKLSVWSVWSVVK